MNDLFEPRSKARASVNQEMARRSREAFWISRCVRMCSRAASMSSGKNLGFVLPKNSGSFIL